MGLVTPRWWIIWSRPSLAGTRGGCWINTRNLSGFSAESFTAVCCVTFHGSQQQQQQHNCTHVQCQKSIHHWWRWGVRERDLFWKVVCQVFQDSQVAHEYLCVGWYDWITIRRSHYLRRKRTLMAFFFFLSLCVYTYAAQRLGLVKKKMGWGLENKQERISSDLFYVDDDLLQAHPHTCSHWFQSL